MKKKDLIELRNKKIADLKKLAQEKDLELTKAGVKIADKSEKNLKKVKNIRRELAQVLTVTREKEIVEKESKNESL
ncbi:MAG: 50S ribosomal protein L29 [Patescibacteria group bacterium]